MSFVVNFDPKAQLVSVSNVSDLPAEDAGTQKGTWQDCKKFVGEPWAKLLSASHRDLLANDGGRYQVHVVEDDKNFDPTHLAN